MIKVKLLFFFFFITSFSKMNSKKQRHVFTVHDTYRETYSPTTVAENNFTDWAWNEGPQEPILSKDSVMKNDSVEHHNLWNLQENQSIGIGLKGNTCDSRHHGFLVIRCPYGWRPVGPFCSTISLVPVYTECPMNFRR
jgi:hypothetical protein